MRYPEAHYRKVLALYQQHGSTARVQDHYPHVSIRTVQRWLKYARTLG